MAKASSTQAWLWNRRLSHLNFDTINLLSKNEIVNGLPKLKYLKDQLCSSYEMGMAKRSNFKTKLFQVQKDGYICFIWTYVVQCGLEASIERNTFCTKLGIQDHRNEPSSSKLVPNVVPTADETYTSLQDVSNSFVISDNLQHQDTQPTLNVQPTSEPIIPPTYVNAEEINTDQAENAEFKAYEFINPFALPGTEAVESSSRNIDTSNMHTFYQRHRSDYHWTKNHLLEQIRGNPSKLGLKAIR
ncbi:retrovirus-related pol polyprotein from transposon TNT 1-94 [Tanacetum coccineum]